VLHDIITDNFSSRLWLWQVSGRQSLHFQHRVWPLQGLDADCKRKRTWGEWQPSVHFVQ